MNEQIVDVAFPLKGLFTGGAYAKQPVGTTPSALNVRGYDPRDGRDRGGQRSGLTSFASAIAGAFPVQDINQVVAAQVALTGSQASTIAWPFITVNGIGLEFTDLSGSGSFGATQGMGITFDNNRVNYVALLSGTNTLNIVVCSRSNLVWTTFQTLATGISISTTRAVPMTTGKPFGYTGNLVFAAAYNGSTTNVCAFNMNPVVGVTVWTTNSAKTPGLQVNPISYCQGRLAVGYASGYVEIYDAASGVLQTTVQLQAADTPDITDIDTDGTAYFYLIANKPGGGNKAWLIKIDLQGNVVYSSSLANYNAVSVAYDNINFQTVVAYTATVGGAVYTVATFDAATGGTLIASATPNAQGWQCVRRSIQGSYVLGNTTSSAGTATQKLMGITSALATLYAAVNVTIGSTASTIPRALAVDSTAITATPGGASSIFSRLIAVSNGTVVRVNSRQTLTGGTKVLNPAVPVIFSTQVNQQLYFADGMTYLYYDAPTDSVLTLTASAGSLPKDDAGNCARLCCTWRNRLVLAGLVNDPTDWFMSAVGDPTDWAENPTPPTETQAVAGNNTTAGENPDAITCLIPYNDEILYFGGLHTIYQMTGDPASGGRVDLVSDIIGMAWGRPWCRDGEGRLYFMSSMGSVYIFAPGGLPQRISDGISEQLLAVDFSTNLVRMAWDERQHGAHLWITPTNATAATFHYFYDAVNQAWWQDQYTNTNHNPWAVFAPTGDTPSSRFILIGGMDGALRQVDPAANNDDGTAITSYCYLGPILDRQGNGMYIADLQCTLDNSSGDASWGVYSGKDAETALAATPIFTGTFTAGRNRSQAVRAFGHAQYIKIGSKPSPVTAWTMDALKARLRRPDGTTRQRTF